MSYSTRITAPSERPHAGQRSGSPLSSRRLSLLSKKLTSGLFEGVQRGGWPGILSPRAPYGHATPRRGRLASSSWTRLSLRLDNRRAVRVRAGPDEHPPVIPIDGGHRGAAVCRGIPNRPVRKAWNPPSVFGPHPLPPGRVVELGGAADRVGPRPSRRPLHALLTLLGLHQLGGEPRLLRADLEVAVD